jgi:hypothetical protein
MKTTVKMLAIAVILLVRPLHAGGIKKWIDEDGTLTFGDAPPPGVNWTETSRRPDPGADLADSDYYAPQNRLYRLQAKSRRKAHQRRQLRDAALEDERLRQQSLDQHRNSEKTRDIKTKTCNHYRARLREYEHRTIQAYRREADRLRDASRLARLELQEAEHCD